MEEEEEGLEGHPSPPAAAAEEDEEEQYRHNSEQEDDEDDEDAYERERQRNIAANQAKLLELGLLNSSHVDCPPPKNLQW
jgi:hypothetical protein